MRPGSTESLGGASVVQIDDYPSPSSAFNRSLLSTLISLPTLVLTVPGLIAGPSMGYFYAGMPGRAWTGIGIRTLGLGTMLSSFAICGWDCSPNDDAAKYAWMAFIGGGAVTVVSAVYDIATVKAATVRRNEERAREAQLAIGFQYFTRLETPGIGVTLRL